MIINKYFVITFFMLLWDCKAQCSVTFLHNQTMPVVQEQHKMNRLVANAQAWIKRSYFSPEMQYAVLALFDRSFAVDKKIGTALQLPTIEEILVQIELVHKKIDLIADQTTQNLARQRMKSVIMQALQETLEAIDLAVYAASLHAAYKDTTTLLTGRIDQALDDQLAAYKKTIEFQLQKYHPTTSWQMFWYGGFTPVHSKPDNIQQIIERNSYKSVQDDENGQKAANLLFKQFLISGQYLIDFMDIVNRYVKFEFQDSLNLFATIPDVDHWIVMLNNAASLVVNNPDKVHELRKIHNLILGLRQALQMALYVANKNSVINYGHLLPVTVTSMLDRLVSQLLKYDAQLDVMCKDQYFGATQDDFYRDRIWSRLSTLASGVAVAGVGTALYYNAGGSRSAIISDSSIANIQDFINNPEKNIYETSKTLTNAAIRKGLELYKLSHETAVKGQSFFEPETWKALQNSTGYVTRDVAPIVHEALISRQGWQDPKAQEEFDKVKQDFGDLLSAGIKSGVKEEVKKVVAAPLSPVSNAYNGIKNYWYGQAQDQQSDTISVAA